MARGVARDYIAEDGFTHGDVDDSEIYSVEYDHVILLDGEEPEPRCDKTQDMFVTTPQ